MQNGPYEHGYTPSVILVRKAVRCWSQRGQEPPPLMPPPSAIRPCSPSHSALALPPLQLTGGAGFIGSHVAAALVQRYPSYKASTGSLCRGMVVSAGLWESGRHPGQALLFLPSSKGCHLH